MVSVIVIDSTVYAQHQEYIIEVFNNTIIAAATAQIVSKSRTMLLLCTPIFKWGGNYLYKLISMRCRHKLASIKVFVVMPHTY